MEKIKVSVVIPVYNIENYIGETLESVARQTWKDMEVIIINDGSTDRTLQKIEEKQGLFDDIKIIDIPNGGVSNARNVGIDKVGGAKIFFWDGDDIMESDTIEKCISFSLTHHVNAVLYGYANWVNGVFGTPHFHDLKEAYFGDDIRKELMPHFMGHSFEDVNKWISGKVSLRYGKEHTAMWRIMVDTETVKKYNLQFDTKLSLGEDTKFINEYMLYEDSIGFMDKCLYYLRRRETGANLTSVMNADKRIVDKMKLIKARSEIDSMAQNMYGINTHILWEGTLVFSAVEMAMRMAQNKKMTMSENFKLYQKFLNNKYVSSAIDNFRPSSGIKSIPFWMLKIRMGGLLFVLFKLLPRKWTNI